MKQRLLSVALLLLATAASAQEKRLTLEEAFVQKNVTPPQNLRQLQFRYNTDSYVYLKKDGGKDVWVQGSFRDKQESTLLTLQALNETLRRSGFDTVASLPNIQFNKGRYWYFNVPKGRVQYAPDSGTVRLLIPRELLNKEHMEESNGGYLAYVDNDNLFVSNGTSIRQVTRDGSRNIVYAASVHRDEFGISKGTFWSPDGKRLAFYRMDQTMVADYPIIDWSATPAKAELIKYPMAGDKSHQVTVGVYDARADKLVFLQTGGPVEQYLTNVAWSPDNRFVYIAVLNREQNHMRLNQYDAATGAFVKTLFEERDEKYVEPLVPMLFLPKTAAQFVWQSNRDGYNHLYLYDTSGRMLRQLTQGAWEVTEVKGFDEKGEHLFYLGTALSPLARTPFRLNLRTGASQQLSAGIAPAVHSIQSSSSGRYLIDVYSDQQHPRSVNVVDVATGKSKNIFEAPDPLAGYQKGQIRISTISGGDGTPIYTRMFLPPAFDSTKKYPVVVYWYGGPHVQLITAGYNGGAGDYWFQYMASRGYLVFSLDPRGSENRGRAFEQAIFRRSGDPQLEDLQHGVAYLRSLPYADTQRMGLFGWSYGGFMTIDYLLHFPGVFKAAVAGGPVTDWRLYEIMYGERYMDTPQENPQGYAATDLTRQVGRLKDHLLLIHGLQDDVVVQQHSVRFVRAAIDKGVQVDYMIYPGHAHNVGGKDRVHLYQKVTDYLDQYLLQ
ncbi:MAG: S9 family peptidase [Chitinophagaceae bacterium]|nr:MAG: S9 family peptidase [Chitinophagaceae bacterium]